MLHVSHSLTKAIGVTLSLQLLCKSLAGSPVNAQQNAISPPFPESICHR